MNFLISEESYISCSYLLEYFHIFLFILSVLPTLPILILLEKGKLFYLSLSLLFARKLLFCFVDSMGYLY